jgi:hypothetical protein
MLGHSSAAAVKGVADGQRVVLRGGRALPAAVAVAAAAARENKKNSLVEALPMWMCDIVKLVMRETCIVHLPLSLPFFR